MLEVIINNNKIFIEKNLTVLQACEQAQISIPRFCYHEKLSVAGNCRMCLVEIEKSPKPVASCAMPVSNGMVIFTETPLVKKAREAVIEFLLINHPLDCPICDQGGECDLQDITLNYGSDRSRFFEYKRGVEDKECGPIVKTIMTRCIHCTRCIRFLTELAGLEVFGAIGRGELMEIGTYLNKYLKTELSGNLVDLCPVGALTSKPYAFLARNWELKKFETVDFSDALGSNIVINSRNNLTTKNFEKTKFVLNDQILRVLPKRNDTLNEVWISDKTRFSFDGNFYNRNLFLEEKSWEKKQFVKTTWSKSFFQKFLINLKTICLKKDLIGTLGTLSSVEESFFYYTFLKSFGNPNFQIENSLYKINKDLPNFYLFTSLLKTVENSDLILLVGVNPRTEGSMLNLKIRKQFFNKEILIGYIGPITDFTFPTLHLGNSITACLQIAEGRHFFCKKILQSKQPLIIFGAEVGFRSDSNIFQKILTFVAKKSILQLKNFSGLNLLHQNLTQINTCDLGLSLNAKSFLYQPTPKLENSEYIFNNVDWSLKKKFLKNTKTFCTLNTHVFTINQLFTYNIPINTLLEKDSIFLNTEGFSQKAFKVTTTSSFSRNSEDFFKALLKLDNKIVTTNKLYIENPFLSKNPENIQQITRIFYLNLFNFKFLYKNTSSNKTLFKNSIKNFYMTDALSKNSKIMAECSLFLANKTNFSKNSGLRTFSTFEKITNFSKKSGLRTFSTFEKITNFSKKSVNETPITPKRALNLKDFLKIWVKLLIEKLKNIFRKNHEPSYLGKDSNNFSESMIHYVEKNNVAKFPNFSTVKYTKDLLMHKKSFFEKFENTQNSVKNTVKYLNEKTPLDKNYNLLLTKDYLTVTEPVKEEIEKIFNERNREIDALKNSETYGIDEFKNSSPFPLQNLLSISIGLFYLFITTVTTTFGQISESFLNDIKAFREELSKISVVFEKPLTGYSKLCHVNQQQFFAVVEAYSNSWLSFFWVFILIIFLSFFYGMYETHSFLTTSKSSADRKIEKHETFWKNWVFYCKETIISQYLFIIAISSYNTVNVTFLYFQPRFSSENFADILILKSNFDELFLKVFAFAKTSPYIPFQNKHEDLHLQNLHELALNILTIEKELSQKIFEKFKQ